MDKKKLRNDIILIASLLLVAAISLVLVLSSRVKSQNVAKVYVHNELTLTIDLSEKEEKDYYVLENNPNFIIHTKEGTVAVLKSDCPHQDCVNMGYVSESNHPIVCAYYAVIVVIEEGATL